MKVLHFIKQQGRRREGRVWGRAVGELSKDFKQLERKPQESTGPILGPILESFLLYLLALSSFKRDPAAVATESIDSPEGNVCGFYGFLMLQIIRFPSASASASRSASADGIEFESDATER